MLVARSDAALKYFLNYFRDCIMDLQSSIKQRRRITTQNIKESTESLFFVLNEFTLSNTVMLLGKKEKEKLVIKLATEGKTNRDIAKEAHVSLKTIRQILNKVTGDDEAEKEQRLESKSDYA